MYDAIPENYVEEEPEDYKAVLKNLQLLQEILNPQEDKWQVKPFIEKMKRRIYPVIDSFLGDARIVLSEQVSGFVSVLNTILFITNAKSFLLDSLVWILVGETSI